MKLFSLYIYIYINCLMSEVSTKTTCQCIFICLILLLSLIEKQFTTSTFVGQLSISMIYDVTEEQVKEAVWRCEGSKSSGPDGFSFNFIKYNWDTLKHNIMEVVLCFQETGCFSKGCNASFITFITLVPKVRDPINLDQYRPISLVGALYKIVTKVLYCRIKNVLPMVIDDIQLKDKGRLDSVLVANEVVEEIRRYRRKDCV